MPPFPSFKQSYWIHVSKKRRRLVTASQRQTKDRSSPCSNLRCHKTFVQSIPKLRRIINIDNGNKCILPGKPETHSLRPRNGLESRDISDGWWQQQTMTVFSLRNWLVDAVAYSWITKILKTQLFWEGPKRVNLTSDIPSIVSNNCISWIIYHVLVKRAIQGWFLETSYHGKGKRAVHNCFVKSNLFFLNYGHGNYILPLQV